MANKVNKAEMNTLLFYCPGCNDIHAIRYAPKYGVAEWSWNWDLERPTINPSILVEGGSKNVRCHSYVRNGQIQFLNDSTHELSGQTVDLPDWPYN